MSEPVNNARRTGPALEAMYQFLLWLIPTIDRFPRSQKFVLGDRIEAAALDVLDALIAATYTRGRDTMLANANLGLERLRFFMRLSQELRLIDLRGQGWTALVFLWWRRAPVSPSRRRDDIGSPRDRGASSPLQFLPQHFQRQPLFLGFGERRLGGIQCFRCLSELHRLTRV
jgi:hypothetical protein